MKEARLAAAVRQHRTLSQATMAELVGKEIGGDLWQAQWSAYELDKSEPPLAVIRAAAKLSGLDESYLAFGGGERAPDADTTMEPDAAPVARPGPRPRESRAAGSPKERRRGTR